MALLSTGLGSNVRSPAARGVLSVALTLSIALLSVIAVEWIARSTLADVGDFLTSTARPGMTTVAMLTILMLTLDAAFGRRHQSALIVVPLVVIPAFVSNQKQHYLSDPFYPSDILFARQIMELLPVMVRDRPFTAVALVIGIALLAAGIVFGWRGGFHQQHKLATLAIGIDQQPVMRFAERATVKAFKGFGQLARNGDASERAQHGGHVLHAFQHTVRGFIKHQRGRLMLQGLQLFFALAAAGWQKADKPESVFSNARGR